MNALTKTLGNLGTGAAALMATIGSPNNVTAEPPKATAVVQPAEIGREATKDIFTAQPVQVAANKIPAKTEQVQLTKEQQAEVERVLNKLQEKNLVNDSNREKIKANLEKLISKDFGAASRYGFGLVWLNQRKYLTPVQFDAFIDHGDALHSSALLGKLYSLEKEGKSDDYIKASSVNFANHLLQKIFEANKTTTVVSAVSR